jgi:hypothetical protein
VSSGLTDIAGKFSITSRDPGSFYLAASALGYRPTRVGVFELDRGGEIDVEFRIYALPISIDGITVSTSAETRVRALVANGFYERMQMGFGRFITPEEIARIPALQPIELFRNIPRVAIVGARSEGQGILMEAPLGQCRPTLWLDGILISRAPTDRDLPLLSEIEAVEVYRGASETPLQWGGTGAQGCGAIIMWTKR